MFQVVADYNHKGQKAYFPNYFSGQCYVDGFFKLFIVKKNNLKQERELTSASQGLYTLAVIIIKFKNTKMIFPIV